MNKIMKEFADQITGKDIIDVLESKLSHKDAYGYFILIKPLGATFRNNNQKSNMSSFF